MSRVVIALSLVIGPSSPLTSSAQPPTCTAAQTRTVVFAFANAWSRGSIARALRRAAPEPQFRWVSVGPPGQRSGAAAFNRASLRQYLGSRRRVHDSLTITRFKFNGSDIRDGHAYGHFEFTARRTSDDWPSTLSHTREAKGAVVCDLALPAVAVWSLG